MLQWSVAGLKAVWLLQLLVCSSTQIGQPGRLIQWSVSLSLLPFLLFFPFSNGKIPDYWSIFPAKIQQTSRHKKVKDAEMLKCKETFWSIRWGDSRIQTKILTAVDQSLGDPSASPQPSQLCSFLEKLCFALLHAQTYASNRNVFEPSGPTRNVRK